MRNKKAQGIGVNVVIVAAIALLVLVIIAMMVAGAGRKASDGINSCAARGGKCSIGMPTPGTWAPDGQEGCSGGETCYVYDYG